MQSQLSWYAIRSKPRKEDLVHQKLLSDGFECFYPRLRVNPVNPRAKKVKPFFPGYLFAQLDLEETGLSYFQWMQNSLGIVTFGGEPAVVPENLIHVVRQNVLRIAEAGGEIFDQLKRGDKVMIESGPFEGYQAIFDTRLPGTERVRILLALLNDHQIPVEIDASRLAKKQVGQA
jgi:transcriptional antiterminator RfaH